MEEILRQLVEGQKQLFDGLKELSSEQRNVVQRLDQLEGKFGNLEGRFGNVESRLGNLEGRFGNLENKIDNLEGQTRENTDILQALMHNNQVMGAEINALTIGTATKEAVERLESTMATKEDVTRVALDVNFLVRKSAEHDSDIRKLSLAK